MGKRAMAQEDGSSPKPQASQQRSAMDPHRLEDMFPDPRNVFKPHSVPALIDETVLVALDASTLLLPYKFSSTSTLPRLRDVYARLANQKRLLVPGRAVREFASNRNADLGNLVQALQQRLDQLPMLPPLLEDVPGYKEAVQSLTELRKAYKQLIRGIKTWHGNDPVTLLYAEMFAADLIVDLSYEPQAREEQKNEHQRRFRNDIPPGTKDARKDDGGIGDVLIWLTLLEMGKKHKKHMVFVTGEQKSDWFTRSGGEPLHPRYELVDEYRRSSEGCSLRLINLHELLREMGAGERAVEDVKSAEEEVGRLWRVRRVADNPLGSPRSLLASVDPTYMAHAAQIEHASRSRSLGAATHSSTSGDALESGPPDTGYDDGR
jgi:PIN domain-containing protein